MCLAEFQKWQHWDNFKTYSYRNFKLKQIVINLKIETLVLVQNQRFHFFRVILWCVIHSIIVIK